MCRDQLKLLAVHVRSGPTLPHIGIPCQEDSEDEDPKKQAQAQKGAQAAPPGPTIRANRIVIVL